MKHWLKAQRFFSYPWRKLDMGVVLALVLLAGMAVQIGYSTIQRSGHFTIDYPPNILPLHGFYGSEQFPDHPRRYRWSKGDGMIKFPNPGGLPIVSMVLAGGPARTIDTTVRTSDGLHTTFTVAPEPRQYTLLLPFSEEERITLWIESPVMRDPIHPKQKLGVVVSDITIAGKGDVPGRIILAAILATILMYGVLRFFHIHMAIVTVMVLVAMSGLLAWQMARGWLYGISNHMLLYGFMLAASGGVALLPIHRRPLPTNAPPRQLSYHTLLALITRSYRWGSLLFFAALPSLATIILVWACCGASVFAFVPFYSDEVFYWHQTLTFTEVGFNGGYYTAHEMAAPLEMFRFYVHGPVFPVLYGTLSMMLGGWHLSSGILFNMLLLPLAFGGFAMLAKLNTRQIVLSSLFLVTFWAVPNFLASHMQESVHHAGAVMLAGGFALLLSPERQANQWVRRGILLLIIGLSLLRITWAMMFVPYFLLTIPQEHRTLRSVGMALAKAVVLGGGLYVITSLWSSPYPNFLSDWIQLLKTGDYLTAASLLTRHTIRNLFFVYIGHILECLQRYQMVALFFAAYLLLVYRVSHRKQTPREQFWQHLQHPLFHLIVLGGIFTIIALFYDMYNLRDYRVFAPYIIVSVLVLIAAKQHTWLVKLIIISNILIFPAFWELYVFIHEPNFNPDPAIAELQTATDEVLVYEPGADPWCNTVLWAASLSDADFRLFPAIPAGFGISFNTEKRHMQYPLKSKYVIINPKEPILKDTSGLRRIGGTDTYHIMVNTHAACP